MTFICPRSVSYTAALCAALQHNTHTTHTQQHSRPLRETTRLIREGCLYLLSTHPSMVDHTHTHTHTDTHTLTHTLTHSHKHTHKHTLTHTFCTLASPSHRCCIHSIIVYTHYSVLCV